MVSRSSFSVLVALCLVSLAVAAPSCAYISQSEQVFDLRPLTGKGASSGDYLATDTNGNKYYWNPCGVSSADSTLKTSSLVQVSSASVVSFRGDYSVTSFTETTVGDVKVTYSASGATSNVHLVCVNGATPALKFRSLVSSTLELEFTYDCCAAGQSFVDNKCRGSNEANVCSTSASNACNSQGKCIGTTAFGTCSCFPGFSGPQCANAPAVGYAPEVAEPHTVFFNPLLKLNLDSRAGVTISVPALSPKNASDSQQGYAAETTITFSGSDQNCNYPYNPNWVITQQLTDGRWYDVYYNVFSYKLLIGCGFSKLAVSSTAGFDTYENVVRIDRQVVFPAGEIEDQLTTRSWESTVDILFPKKLSVTSNVYVADNSITTFTGIVYSNYDIPTAMWTFVFSASVTAPYMVKLNGNVVTNALPERAVNFGALTTCSSPTGTCTQNITITAKGCAGFSFVASVPLLVQCRPGSDANCPPAAVTSLTPQVTVELGSACPVAQNTKFGSVTLSPYSDSALTKTNANFGTQTDAYFGVFFTATVAVSAITVDKACARPYSTASGFSACGTNAGDKILTATPVPVFVGGTAAQYAFSVKGSQLGELFAPVTTTPRRLTIQVDLTITSATGKRSIQVLDAATSTTSITLSTNPESVPTQTGTLNIGVSNPSSASVITFGALTAAAAVLLI